MAEGSSSLFTWEDQAGVEHTLNVDVVSSSVDERTATPTDHPVETGAVISDHVVINPKCLSLELVVSQTPIEAVEGFERTNVEIGSVQTQALEAARIPIKVRRSQFVPSGFLLLSQGLRTAVESLITEIGGTTADGSKVSIVEGKPVAVNVLQSTGGQARDRVGDAHDALVNILENALLVTVNFKGRIYQDYVLTRVTLTDNPGEFGMGRFAVDLRTISTVTGAVVQLPEPADFRMVPKKSKGNKAPKPPKPDPTELKSLSATLVDSGLVVGK